MSDNPLAEFPRYEQVTYVNSGSYGTVVKAFDRQKQEEIAVKLIPRGTPITRFVESEILNLRKLDFPHIVGFKHVFLTDKYLCIAMEYANLGNLHNYVRDLGRGLDEQEARWYFQQLILAVDFCHRMVFGTVGGVDSTVGDAGLVGKGVANRDIKLDNTLLTKNPKEGLRPIIKLADFGYSRDVHASKAETRVGTLDYFAPEILALKQGEVYDAMQADMWSLGVVLYSALARCYPFRRSNDNTDKQYEFVNTMLKRIRGNEMNPLPPGTSSGCQDLIRKLLDENPTRRYRVEDVCRDPWFRKDLPLKAEAMLMQPRGQPMHVDLPPNLQSEEDIIRIVQQARTAPGVNPVGHAVSPGAAHGPQVALKAGPSTPTAGGRDASVAAFQAASHLLTSIVALQGILGQHVVADAARGGDGGPTAAQRRDVEAALQQVNSLTGKLTGLVSQMYRQK